jgi:hypothetical protein
MSNRHQIGQEAFVVCANADISTRLVRHAQNELRAVLDIHPR